MRQVVVIILLLFCSAGIVFSPSGNFSCINYVPEVYSRCIAEDPEITLCDFLFEHLLYLESFIEFMEHGGDQDTDPPGLPYQLPQQVIQTIVILQPPLSIYFNNDLYTCEGKNYALYRNTLNPASYAGEIFHPPSA